MFFPIKTNLIYCQSFCLIFAKAITYKCCAWRIKDAWFVCNVSGTENFQRKCRVEVTHNYFLWTYSDEIQISEIQSNSNFTSGTQCNE